MAGEIPLGKCRLELKLLLNVNMLFLPQTMRRQRTEVVVELRKVIILCYQCQTRCNYDFHNPINFKPFICSLSFK